MSKIGMSTAITLLVDVLLGVCLESVGDHHEEDHAEGRDGLGDAVAEEDVHPADLLRGAALSDRAGVGEHIENAAKPDVQHDDELDNEQQTARLLNDWLHRNLQLPVEPPHQLHLEDKVTR